jgi:ketosteroid isomerase-like protein
MTKSLFLVLLTVTFFSSVHAQNNHNNQSQLYNQILEQDSIFFAAFNRCDTVTYRTYLTDDFEFYHDLGGLHKLDEEMQSMREMCARNSNIRRELIKSSLEVHELGDYGALEIGVHRFFHTNPGQTEHESGTYKFVQIWRKSGASWKLARVISYDHGKMNNN